MLQFKGLGLIQKLSFSISISKVDTWVQNDPALKQ